MLGVGFMGVMALLIWAFPRDLITIFLEDTPENARVIALGVSFLAIAVLDELVHVLRGNRPSYDKEPPTSPEEFVARVAEGGGV